MQPPLLVFRPSYFGAFHFSIGKTGTGRWQWGEKQHYMHRHISKRVRTMYVFREKQRYRSETTIAIFALRRSFRLYPVVKRLSLLTLLQGFDSEDESKANLGN